MGKAKAIDPLAVVRTKPASVKTLMLNPAASRNAGRGIYDPLPTVPMEIFACTNLEELEIFRGVVAGPIPRELGTLRKLRRLSLGGFQFTALPDELCELANLEVLELHYAHALTALPPTIGKLGKLRELAAAYSGLAELPRSIGGLAALELLTLPNTRITAVPAELWQLKALTQLQLPDTLTTLPAGIGGLASLEELTISAAALASVARELPRLTNLRVLRVTGKATALPAAIGELPALKELRAGYLELVEPPAPHPTLTRLELAGNKLTTARVLLAQYPKLVELDIADNPIPTPERRELDKLMKLTPAKRAAALGSSALREQPVAKGAKPKLLGTVASINAALTLVIGDSKVIAKWRGVGDGTEDLDETDWQRAIDAIGRKDVAPVAVGKQRAVVVAGIGNGVAHVYAVDDRIVVVEAFAEEGDDLYQEWVASPPVKPRRVADLATPSGKVALVSCTDPGDLRDGGLALPSAKKLVVSLEAMAKASWGDGRRFFLTPG